MAQGISMFANASASSLASPAAATSIAMQGMTFGSDMLNVLYGVTSDLLGMFTRPAVGLRPFE